MFIASLIITVLAAFPSLNGEAAKEYADSHRPAWQSIWYDLEVNPMIAESIVFPEMVRYSAWQDQLEHGIVSTSYVQLGSNGPDFSIGHFQMKASWVEQLELCWMHAPLHRQLEIYFDINDLKPNARSSQIKMARKARMARLADEDFWHPVYVGMFLRMLFLHLPELKELPVEEQIRLCATAYNHGINWKRLYSGTASSADIMEELYRQSTLNTFHTDLVANSLTTTFYNYGEIAVNYYSYIPH